MASYSRIYDKIDAIYECFNGTAKVVVDSVFAQEEQEALIKSYQNVEVWNGRLWIAKWRMKQLLFRKWLSGGCRDFKVLFPDWRKRLNMMSKENRK
jgi:hypothetical protein